MDDLGFNGQATVSHKGKATAHTFRDTFAARQIEAGATLYELQHLLGHADPSMTQKYAHIYADFGIKAAARLDVLHAVKGAAGASREILGAIPMCNQGRDPIPAGRGLVIASLPCGLRGPGFPGLLFFAWRVPTVSPTQAVPTVARSRYYRPRKKPKVLADQELPASVLAPRPGLEPVTYGLTVLD